MANISPFKAIRPAKDKVAHVVSNSYQSYGRRELNAELSFNPFSFLHILNPGYKHAKKISGEERFKLVHERYLEFLKNNIFLKDAHNSFYLYEIEKKDFKCCGLFCGTSVEDYRNNIIKKHENTLQRREALFANYLNTVKFNAEPVLMTYADDAHIGAILTQERAKEPNYQFATTDKVHHKLWVISDTSVIKKLQTNFKRLEALYIADGHHRTASSDLLAKNLEEKNPDHKGNEPYNFFMSYLIPESEVRIFEFNRMVKGLNGLSKKDFLTKLEGNYRITNHGNKFYKPSKKHHFNMYLDKEFYSLYLRKDDYSFTDVLSALDTQILYKTILEPILGIHDLRKDKRIKYGYGKDNALKMKEEIDKGRFTVGFGMVPLTIHEIKAIADAGLVMPPKSTYIEPKLRSGLAIYEL